MHTTDTSEVEFKLYLHIIDTDDERHIIDVVETVCASVYDSQCTFEVIRNDERINEQPVLITPALVRLSPSPVRCYFGDFSDPERLHTLLSEDRRSTLTCASANP